MATDDFFRARLDQMIDLRHPLAALTERIPWSQLEASLAPSFADRLQLFAEQIDVITASTRPVADAYESGCIDQKADCRFLPGRFGEGKSPARPPNSISKLSTWREAYGAIWTQ